jgi:dGTPase
VLKPYGGFSHNDQTLRVLTKLERRYAGFDGLNLTWETLEGTVKHNGPLARDHLPQTIAAYVKKHDLELATWPSAEAQVAALSDDIAYNNHDLDDGLRAQLFTLKDLAALPLLGTVFAEVNRRHAGIEESRLIHETIRRLIDRTIADVVEETQRRLEKSGAVGAADIRALGAPVVAFSEAMRTHDRALRAFLMERMYRHYRVARMASKARRVVTELFRLFHGEPLCLPAEWRAQTDGAGTAVTARVVADYIAGMTDRFALDEHNRLFDPNTAT